MPAKTYHGQPCAKCNSIERYSRSKRCVVCEKERAKKWYRENTARARERIRQWQLANKDKVIAQAKNWHRRNPGRRQQIANEWYENNKERTYHNNKRWASKNRDKIRSYKQKYRTSQTNAGGSFTEKEWRQLCNLYDNRCLACGKKEKLCADHIIPVSKGGSSNISNIQPLCRSCNASKQNKIIDYRPLVDG